MSSAMGYLDSRCTYRIFIDICLPVKTLLLLAMMFDFTGGPDRSAGAKERPPSGKRPPKRLRLTSSELLLNELATLKDD